MCAAHRTPDRSDYRSCAIFSLAQSRTPMARQIFLMWPISISGLARRPCSPSGSLGNTLSP